MPDPTMPPSAPVPFDPDWVVPTSMMLREWLDSTGLSPRVAAARVPADQRDAATSLLLGVLDGAPVTEDTARLLFVVTDISAAFWLAFERNYRAGLAAGKTVVADSESDDPAQAGEPKPYLCGCPSDDPRPCPLHDRDSASTAQAGGQS